MPDQNPLEQRPEPEELLMRLDRDIRRFRIDFERFFSGNLPIPPDQLRISVQNQIKEIHSVHLKAVSHRFRFNTLEAKFNAFLVLFNRRLRDLETGRAAPRPGGETSPALDPEEGVIIGDSASTEAVAALFKGLYMTAGGRPPADLQKFESYLQQQADKIRQETGCSQVRFRVTNEGGKPKLKAKPLRRE